MARSLQEMSRKTFNFYIDPGHAWLAVKRTLLIEMNIADKVSNYSYQRGKTVYLEEDCDARLFVESYRVNFGCAPIHVEKYTDKDSPIRGYEYYADWHDS